MTTKLLLSAAAGALIGNEVGKEKNPVKRFALRCMTQSDGVNQ